MEKKTEEEKTFGQVVDEIIKALSSINEDIRLTAIRSACEFLKIQLPEQRSTPSPPTAPPLSEEQSNIPRITDIRSLKEEKKPSTASEMAALVAYYLSELAPESEQKSEVEVADMEKYFKQAVFLLPTRPEFILTNAKNAGYFESTGQGKYKLNPVGYNLVVHRLPRLIKPNLGSRNPRKRRVKKAKPKNK